MAQTIRLTITPDLEKALFILRQSTLGTMNTTELIKMAVGGFAQIKKGDVSLSPHEIDVLSYRLFDTWAQEDNIQDVDNIAHPEKLKPYHPK